VGGTRVGVSVAVGGTRVGEGVVVGVRVTVAVVVAVRVGVADGVGAASTEVGTLTLAKSATATPNARKTITGDAKSRGPNPCTSAASAR
jgi:hypothetical protein